MKRFIFFICTIFIFLYTHLFGNFSTYKTSSVFLGKNLLDLPISSWKNPTLNDYMMIQRQLYINIENAFNTPLNERGFFSDPSFNGEYGWIVARMSKLRLIDERNPLGTEPKCEIIYFNKNPEDRENCIVCYSSYPVPNRNYVNVDNIIKALKAIDFNGHLIYRIGGWPNPEKERLKFADVPYSFKPFMIEEARDLGYENILWLDVCALPIKNLDHIFDRMHSNGFCFFSGSSGTIPQVFLDARRHVKEDLGLLGKTKYESYKELSSRIIGFNVKHPKGALLLDKWIAAAERKDAFFTGNVDQTVLGYLVNGLDMYDSCEMPLKYYYEGNATEFEQIPNQGIESEAIFYFSYQLIEGRHFQQNLLGAYPSIENCVDYMLGLNINISDRYYSDFWKMPLYIQNYFSDGVH